MKKWVAQLRENVDFADEHGHSRMDWRPMTNKAYETYTGHSDYMFMLSGDEQAWFCLLVCEAES